MEYTQRSTWTVRAAALFGAGALALLAAVAPAAADVVVTPSEAAQRDAANLTFRITNESRTASVTAVDVQLPADTPIAEVYPLSVPDWAPAMNSVKIDKPVESLHGYQITDVTTAVRWVAMPGRALPPGGTTELYLSIGPLPAAPALSFGVVLSNSDGTQVRWSGESGAEHAAPVLVLKAGPAGQGAHAADQGAHAADQGAHAADQGGATAEANEAAAAPDDPAAVSDGPSYIGWALGALLLVAAICIVGLVIDRRREPTPS